ncbi:short chain dehydrogenase family [Ophiostoma piceae UAMH 11346]|uniref:Short chain dehydrogenase family n=1 Tax=Ophiostoma piceae (strain UAMH 11346) TaxID=1262450 RepID=S3BW15_OPHP1|nr:short chain dehydrogenase family [Ophiostoma piceae UAMH 11346]
MTSKTVAIITGANQGIGFASAKLLATEHKDDYTVILAGRRKEAIEEAAAKLTAQGLPVESLVLDVTSDDSIAAAVKEVETKYGRLDVLVNNAAISTLGNPSDKSEGLSPEARARREWNAVLNTNVTSVAAVTDAFLPLLKKSVGTNGPKRIVFVSSTLASIGYKTDPKAATHPNLSPTSPYTTSKAALNMLAMHYAVQFEKDEHNWKINLTCPGYCATGLNQFSGYDTPDNGAINTVRLATLDFDGEAATFTNRQGPIPW